MPSITPGRAFSVLSGSASVCSVETFQGSSFSMHPPSNGENPAGRRSCERGPGLLTIPPPHRDPRINWSPGRRNPRDGAAIQSKPESNNGRTKSHRRVVRRRHYRHNVRRFISRLRCVSNLKTVFSHSDSTGHRQHFVGSEHQPARLPNLPRLFLTLN